MASKKTKQFSDPFEHYRKKLLTGKWFAAYVVAHALVPGDMIVLAYRERGNVIYDEFVVAQDSDGDTVYVVDGELIISYQSADQHAPEGTKDIIPGSWVRLVKAAGG